MDSMVNHYTVARKRRREDAYSPGGQAGLRPNHAAVVYSNLIRRTFKKTPIVLGGIEASLRRLAHYDYWSDKMKRSILLDSGADLVSFGMGERSVVEIADALAAGLSIDEDVYKRQLDDGVDGRPREHHERETGHAVEVEHQVGGYNERPLHVDARRVEGEQAAGGDVRQHQQEVRRARHAARQDEGPPDRPRLAHNGHGVVIVHGAQQRREHEVAEGHEVGERQQLQRRIGCLLYTSRCV